MALTTFILVPAELEEAYWGGLQAGDRFTLTRIRVKSIIQSRQKIAGLTKQSYLPKCSEWWDSFTEQQKQDWKNTDFHSQKHGWRHFLADQCKRIKYGIEGTATPSEYHNAFVGKIQIEAPASEIKLIQAHPYKYWISKKVSGKKEMYEPVEITEAFYLPLKIGLSIRSNLISAGAGSFAKFYARILHFYQGQNLYDNLEINIPLSSDWTRLENTVSSLIGKVISYNLYIHLYNVQGELLFDHAEATHTSQNWARDIFCKKVEQSFTRMFYLVPKNWAPITLPEGADYQSIYPD